MSQVHTYDRGASCCLTAGLGRAFWFASAACCYWLLLLLGATGCYCCYCCRRPYLLRQISTRGHGGDVNNNEHDGVSLCLFFSYCFPPVISASVRVGVRVCVLSGMSRTAVENVGHWPPFLYFPNDNKTQHGGGGWWVHME